VNAVFHKSYQIREPVEVRIYIDCIIIINHPGPEPYIDMEKLTQGKAIGRRYRNRRIGEFFKEIDLSEKKSTGITKILGALEKNGSPPPIFETSNGREFMQVTIKMHEGFDVDHFATKTPSEQVNRQAIVLSVLSENPTLTIKQLSEATEISIATLRREMKIMKNNNQIKRKGSDKKRILGNIVEKWGDS